MKNQVRWLQRVAEYIEQNPGSTLRSACYRFGFAQIENNKICKGLLNQRGSLLVHSEKVGDLSIEVYNFEVLRFSAADVLAEELAAKFHALYNGFITLRGKTQGENLEIIRLQASAGFVQWLLDEGTARVAPSMSSGAIKVTLRPSGKVSVEVGCE